MVTAERACASDALMSVRGLGKQFWLDRDAGRKIVRLLGHTPGSSRVVHALRDVSFNVKAGEAVALLGRNGSGKSTLLSIITGVRQPTVGTVVRSGKIASLLELAWVPSRSHGPRERPAHPGAERAQRERPRGVAMLDGIAEFADIGEFFDRPFRTYSTGMFIRLAFAAQTVSDPDVWIVDEALGVGDFVFREKALRWLRAFLDRGGALLLATHDTGLADAFCDRAIVLDGGCLVHDGPVPAATQLYVSRYSQPGVRGSDADWPSLPLEARHLRAVDVLAAAIGRPTESDYLSKQVELLGVTVQDEDGRDALEFSAGDTMRVSSIFCAHAPQPHVSVTLILHDVHGRMVWAVAR